MTRPAIIVQAISQWVQEGRDLVRAVVEAEALVAAYDRKLSESREDAQRRRMAAGAFLNKVRAQMPKRGTAENGWKAFLEAIEVDDSTAHRWMDLADPLRLTMRSKDEAPAAGPSSLPDAPPPTDADAPREIAEEAGVAQPDVEIDRDTWCTPRWITEAIGEWDLDPCANERSHVQAKKTFMLEARGEDGIVLAPTVKKSTRVFLNPPYSHVMPWVEAYAHTRFCFLLKVDPSTKWFEALLSKTELVLIPRRTRIQFEPPEGVPPEKAIANQFPHALFYARGDDASDAIQKLCFPPWRIR